MDIFPTINYQWRKQIRDPAKKGSDQTGSGSPTLLEFTCMHKGTCSQLPQSELLSNLPQHKEHLD